MRQLFLEKGILSIKEVCEPKLDDYSVIVSVHYSFISSGKGLANIISANQELFYENIPNKVKKILEIVTQHGVDYTAKMIKDKLAGKIIPLGQSCSGQVIAVGKQVKKFRIGDFVACAGAGLANHADVVCVPQNLIVPIDEKFLKESSLTAVGAMALQSIRRANLQLGESVCVFGLETLGQMISQLAKISGCKVIGVDSNDELLQKARQSGIENSYNFIQDNLLQSIELLTNSIGVDCVIITPDCAQENIIQDALKIVRKKGRIVIVENRDIQLKKNLIGHKEIDVLFSLSYGPGRYDPMYEYMGNDYPYPYVRWTENRNMEVFANLIETNQINLSNFVKNEFNLDSISKAIETINTNNSLGVVLNYLSDKKLGCPQEVKDQKITFVPAFKDSMRVGIIGASKFTQLNLMPIISKLNNVVIDTIIDRDMVSSLNAAKLHPGALARSGNAGLFTNNNCNVVIVSPSADITSDEIVSILQKGKAIFIAKSLDTNLIDFQQLKQFFLNNKKSYLCVAYPRTHSPFIEKIKKAISKRNSPLMIQYRFNAGFIPKEQRMQAEWKSGRVIIEASHIFDLFCYLTGSKPVSVSVESLKYLSNVAFPTDNFCATISFDDGSVCSLLFTSLGHMDLSKERMELFYDSKSIVMEDYLSLTGYGIPPTFDERVKVPDQGYEKLITKFFENIKNEKSEHTFSLERLTTVTDLTLIVDQLACQGGGELQL